MSNSVKKSKNEYEEHQRQLKLRDARYLEQTRRKMEQDEATRRLKLTEYLRLKGELE